MRKELYCIGVDVGGTNTDAALLRNGKVLASAKSTTTEDITSGIINSINKILQDVDIKNCHIHHITFGTTHLLNALLLRKLDKVMAIRLGAPASDGTPPFCGWPHIENSITEHVYHSSVMSGGGFEYSGKEITKIDNHHLETLAQNALDKGINAVAICGIFSPIKPEQENQAAEIMSRANNKLNISLSHRIGGLSILERENANILNASLHTQFQKLCDSFTNIAQHLKLPHSPRIFLAKNDGTVQELFVGNTTEGLPILSLNAAISNSMQGASLLCSEINDAIVIDVGGTSTDLGVILNNRVLDYNNDYHIEGVKVKLPSLLVQSIALGGGTLINTNGNQVSLHTESVGSQLETKAMVFGGEQLTVTDIAVALNPSVTIGDASNLNKLDKNTLDKANHLIHDRLVSAVKKLLGSLRVKPKTLIMVGGGAILFDHSLLKEMFNGLVDVIHLPQHYSSVNAIGSALAKMTGQHVELFLNKDKETKDLVISEAKIKAIKNLVAQGADSLTAKIHSIKEIPIPYLPNNPTQLIITATGTVAQRQRIPLIESEESSSHNHRLDQLLPNNIAPIKIGVDDTEYQLLSKSQHYTLPALSPRAPIKNPDIKTELTVQQVDDIALGAAYLGSGGGGDPSWTALMTKNTIQKGHKVHLVDVNQIKDDAVVALVGYIGSPAIAAEKSCGATEVKNAILNMEAHLGRKLDAVIPVEAGGGNALSPFSAAAELGLPVIDGDFMGRAFPGAHYLTSVIFGDTIKDKNVLHNIVFSMSTGSESAVFKSDFVKTQSATAYQHATEMGGAAICVYSPMSGEQVKRLCIQGTLSTAGKIGRAIRLAQEAGTDILTGLNECLATTNYGKAECLFTGEIIECPDHDIVNSQNKGSILLENTLGERIEVGFCNEFLIAKTVKKVFGQKDYDVRVPDILTLVDQYTMQPIFAQDVRFGQQVTLISIRGPELLYSEQAAFLFGEKAFDTESLLKHQKKMGPALAKINSPVSALQNTDAATDCGLLDTRGTIVQEKIRNIF